MVIKLLHTVLLFLFPSMTVIGQVLDTDTLCYKNNTVYQELITLIPQHYYKIFFLST